MNSARMLLLWLTLIVAAIAPTTLFAQSSYSCDCAADTLNCSDFASPADAQACFWNCGSQGAGDIHRLDADMNAVACDVLASPTAMPTAMPVYVEPTSVPVMPTAVPVYEVCSCGGDYYDCGTFSGPSHAQGCYDYCAGQGFGDVHQMDPDGDGMACLVSASAFTVIEATPVPAYVAPTPVPTAVYVAPTAVPAPAPASALLPFVGIMDNPSACSCDYDQYNCNNFGTQADSQSCFWHCGAQGAGDIHRLDQGGIKGVTCEEYGGFTPILPEPSPFVPVLAAVTSSACSCDYDLNCDNFSTADDAQTCFVACGGLNGLDVHQLDRDGDLLACEWNPDE